MRPMRLSLSPIRSFSTTLRRNMEWNVVVFDKPNTDRSQVRAAHLQAIPAAVNGGHVTFAGAIFKDASKSQFAGSTLHVVADTRDDVVELLKKDVYATSGIWDVDNALIHPVGVAVRLPKKLDGVTKGFD